MPWTQPILLANSPGTQRASFHLPPHASGSFFLTNVHFVLQNLGTKLSCNTMFFLGTGGQNNESSVVIPVMLKDKYLSMTGKLHVKVTIFQG